MVDCATGAATLADLRVTVVGVGALSRIVWAGDRVVELHH